MEPAKGYQDTHDGIEMLHRRKGYERPNETTAKNKSFRSSTNSDESNPSTISCGNSTPSTISCGNSTSLTSSANSDESNLRISSGNSSEQNGNVILSNWTLRLRENQLESLTSSANSDESNLRISSGNSSEQNVSIVGTNWTLRPTENDRKYPLQAATPWERNGGRTVGYFDPQVRNRPRRPMGTQNGNLTYRDQNRTLRPRENHPENLKPRSCSRRCAFGVTVIALVFLSAAIALIVHFTRNLADNDECIFLNNEIQCPWKPEYHNIEIFSPPDYLKGGTGRFSHGLDTNTDILIGGFNVEVKDQKIHIRKKPNGCEEEGEYPIIFTNENKTQIKTKLPLRVKDFTDTLQTVITPFTNVSDNRKYVQVTCTGHRQCGTVVMDLELQTPEYGTYNTPMKCSRTNLEGTILDNYGYVCTLNMDVRMFQRIENIKCKPTVETLQNATTTSIAQKSVDVNEATQSHFILRKWKQETIKWNVHVQSQSDLRHLQTKHNGEIHGNTSDLNARVKLFTSVTGHIATCRLVFDPATCIDEGSLTLHLSNSTLHKEIQLNGTSTIRACSSVITGNVDTKMDLKCKLCVPDAARKYALYLHGKTIRLGSFLNNRSIEIDDQTTYFKAHLHLNELSVTYTKERATCHDHMTVLMMSLLTEGGDTIQNITSRTDVIAGQDRYKTSSTGGDFRENIPAAVILRMHVGCRPQNISIYVNGSLMTSNYNLSEDRSTGEKLFNKTFSFPNTTMQDNGTIVKLRVHFTDDEGSSRNLIITQPISVVPDTFCQGKTHGCNYAHPYNRNMWIACGEGLIAGFGNCQPGLHFAAVSCEGKCL